MNEQYKIDFKRAMAVMKSFGYVVVAFSPEDLEGADPSRVEDHLIENGWDIISSLTS